MAIQHKTRIESGQYYQLPDYEQNDFIQLIDGEVVVDLLSLSTAKFDRHEKHQAYAMGVGHRYCFLSCKNQAE